MLKTDDRRLKTTLLLCYITDRSQFPGNETARRTLLLEKIAEASRAGVDFIQMREKTLSSHDLETLTNRAMQAIRRAGKAKLLINSRPDIAMACGADGVHLPSNDISPVEAQQIWEKASKCGGGRLARPTISISCHTPSEVKQAEGTADLALFAPVFEKSNQTTTAGLETLIQACQVKIPVLALGGITLENAPSCLKAGASGIAAIRLFQQNEISRVVESLRQIELS